ncbi:MAG: TRAP transporter substrate-binding protein DctP [Deltaproteobacteria bacterium]|nr:MAG: TRAP transporter substrate-binding protein DctP [Deltaproteobacteria bacterium]
MNKGFSKIVAGLVMSLAVLAGSAVQAQQASNIKELKFATLAPSGSSWDKLFVAWKDEVIQRTNGQVVPKIYAGGVQGDEKAVVQKIRSGQLVGGGLTGFGLGMIAPSVRALELPFLFKDGAEVDTAIQKVDTSMRAAFNNGNPQVELLGWAEAGFVYIMSNKPIAKLDDMKGVKMWMWEGDPVAEALYSSLNVTPVQLSIADVLTSLQTSMIEAVYAPPMGAVALQWASKVKYVTDLPLANSIGGLVMSKAEFSKLTPEQQKILKEVSQKYCRQIVEQTRKDNAAAFDSLVKLGVQKVSVADADKQALVNLTVGVGDKLVGKLYDQATLSSVRGK